MYAAGIVRPFRARHYLAQAGPEESLPHAHPYRVELVCRTAKLDANGYSVDIALLERTLEAVLDEWDDVLLNDLPEFTAEPPTLENLARRFVERMRSVLRARGASPMHEIEIRIWESESAWASYSEST